MIDFDFHVHSKYSNCARQSVEEAFLRAASANIKTIAITDHDTIAAHREAREMGQKYGITFIPGIEVSTMLHEKLPLIEKGVGIHVLGLYIDDNQEIIDRYYLESKTQSKARRKKLVTYLSAILGIDLSGASDSEKTIRSRLVESKVFANDADAKKYLKSPEILNRFPKYHMSIPEAIKMIHELHGLAILAHPFRGENHLKLVQSQVVELIDFACSSGIDGLEVFHCDNFEACGINYLLKKAKEKQLIISLGSDRHFFEDKCLGKYFVMEDDLQAIAYDYEGIKNHLLKEKKI